MYDKAPRKLGLRDGAQFKELVPQQEQENLGFDTRRRLCGDRNEGESVGAEDAGGECISNQNERHRGKFDKEYQIAASENVLGRSRDIVLTRSSTR